VCITKPRRFGKSSIASMVIAYYSQKEKEEFQKIFDNLNVSKNEDTEDTEDTENIDTSEKKKKKKKIKKKKKKRKKY